MTMMNNFINTREELWAIDAKYLERTEFYFKVCGELEGMRSAIIWFGNCSDNELREALSPLTAWRELLDKWYFRI